ncbi:EamA family transporter [Marinicrinis lubricantis]|uniref:DMT family transporter n=1 Tax=Marinicrinis lubricantis TaxID=2086470 RepID=A0ABW1IK81_9BACL
MWKSIILVLLGGASYGILSTFVKLAYREGYTVDQVIGSQMLYGALLLWCIALPLSRWSFNLRQWLALGLIGCFTASTGMLYYAALQFIPASFAILLLFQFTWIGVLIDSIWSRKLPAKSTYLSLVFLLLGTFLAGGILEGNIEFHIWGTLLGLLAAVSYSFFILLSGKIKSSLPSVSRSAVTVTGGLLLAWIVFGPAYLWDGSLASPLSFYGLLLGLFGMVIPTLFYAIGVARIGGTLASILSAAELPVAVLMSTIVLKEHVSLLQWIGVLLILFGVAFPQRVWRRRKTAQGTS